MKAKIVKTQGGWVHFEAEDFKEITEDKAMLAQSNLGYIQAGYGFEDFKITKDLILLRYKATWKCQAACE